MLTPFNYSGANRPVTTAGKFSSAGGGLTPFTYAPYTPPAPAAPEPSLVEKTVTGIKGVIGGAKSFGTDIYSALTKPIGPPQEGAFTTTTPSVGDDIGLTTINSYAAALKDAGDKLVNVKTTFSDKKSTSLDKGLAVGEAGLGALNAFFAPLTAAGAGAAQIPAIGHVAQAINNLFGAIGSGSADIGEGSLQAIPGLSQETKDKLKPLVTEVFSLAGQIAAGKGGEDVHSLLTSKTSELAHAIADKIPTDVPENTGALKPFDYAKSDTQVTQAFGSSSGQRQVGNFEIGTFGENALERKAGQPDRFPASELADTQTHITEAYNASDNPNSYRSGNIAWVAEMPNGEKRVIYTRKNANGAEEVINAHTVTDPKFIDTLKSFGTPDQSRTGIISLERSGPSPLADRGTNTLPAEPNDVNEKPVDSQEIQVNEPVSQDKTNQTSSGLAKSIETKAVDAGLTEGYDKIAGYEGSTIEKQKTLFNEDFATHGVEGLRDLLTGKRELPGDLRASSVIDSAERYLKKNPSADMAYELANSPLVSKVSQAGSELGLLQNREQDSYTAKTQAIRKAREARAGATAIKKAKSVPKEAKKAMNEVNLSSEDLGKLSDFIDKLVC